MDDAGPATRVGVADLLGQLGTDLASLVRKEAELARAEISEKLNAAGKAVVDIAAGGLLLIAALLVLLQALVLALSKFMDPTWAALLVGVVVAGVGYLLVRGGMKAISLKGLKPDRSVRQLQKDADLMKGNSQ
jgi:positive regulator of sigma E activity